MWINVAPNLLLQLGRVNVAQELLPQLARINVDPNFLTANGVDCRRSEVFTCIWGGLTSLEIRHGVGLDKRRYELFNCIDVD